MAVWVSEQNEKANSPRSATRNVRAAPKPARPASDSDHTPNRSRSQSNASSTKGKEKRSMLPSFGSRGKKGFGTTFTKVDEDESKEKLNSDEETYRAAPMRRTHTTPRNTRMVKMLYDFPGNEADGLPLKVGQVVEVQKEVSEDWWIGESEGRSGLFPSAYCEEYVKPVRLDRPASPGGYMTSDSEASNGYSDTELTAPLAAPKKKPAPPPPPGRRSASSNNILTSGTFSTPRPPTRPRANTSSRVVQLDSPQEGSPFAGSDEEEQNSLSHGLATSYLGQNGGSHEACGKCGCGEFTQNVLKAKGMCSTCYHRH